MKTIVAIGDIHVGDSFAICPDRFETSVGEAHRPNKGQRYLLKCFGHLLDNLPEKFDILLINGDVIQGTREARYIWEPDQLFQARAAVELLKPLVERAEKAYVLQGTLWHSGEGSEAEEKVGEALGTVKWGSHYCWPFLRLNLDGVRIDIAHHLSQMTAYRSTALEREINYSQLIHDWATPPDLIIRSHIHHYYNLNAEGRIGITLPGWQLWNIFCQTSTMATRKFSKWLGAVKITIDPEKKHKSPQNASEFIEIAPFLYQHPVLTNET